MQRCQPSCANIARTDSHADQLRQHAQELGKRAASEALPDPLADRLARRSAHLLALADRHEHDRIHLQEPTS
ncbi:hypothetical protein JK361_37365 [Streptomyces sp. 5-8]|uniref:Uncharacterized protein n=1 Tax=Streptomyces musisoli TaxID=2802280 RepID=A0ABS1PCR2_9ACTN|nr:hypothetical protein [Streptomyces musisoli]MBL1110163.1 hypothetical protein [Streptomyces musisoli]